MAALAHDRLGRALALALLLAPTAGALAAGPQGRARVVDGDTLEVAGTRVRLAGVDAPELGQRCATEGDVLAAGSATYPCGERAAAALADRLAGDPVACEPAAAGGTGAVPVAVCWLNDEDLGAWLVRAGWARAFPPDASPYAREEDLAQAALAGIWRGDFLDPWDWRRARRSGAEGARQLRVAVGAANVRSAPSRRGGLLATLPRGATVRRLGQSGGWLLVELPDGASGWMLGELLEPLGPGEEADP